MRGFDAELRAPGKYRKYSPREEHPGKYSPREEHPAVFSGQERMLAWIFDHDLGRDISGPVSVGERRCLQGPHDVKIRRIERWIPAGCGRLMGGRGREREFRGEPDRVIHAKPSTGFVPGRSVMTSADGQLSRRQTARAHLLWGRHMRSGRAASVGRCRRGR